MEIKVKKLYQWDLDCKVEIELEEDEAIDEINFFNPKGDAAYVVEPKVEGEVVLVDIPNILLQEAVAIHMYTVKSDQTTAEYVFRVIPRQKPSDYVYTETEVLSYKALEDRVKALEESSGEVSEEDIAKAVNDYLSENPVQAGATKEQAEQIAKNTEDISDLKKNGTSYRRLGVVPYTTDEVLDIKLTSDSASNFTAQTPTVGEWDNSKATYSKCSYSEEDGFMVLTSTADTTAWHQNLAKCVVEGFVVGEQYKLIVDASNTPETEENKYAGQFYVYDANGTLINPSVIKMYKDGELYGTAQSSSYYNDRVTVAEFTATTESLRINWYPHNSNNFVAGQVSTSRISGLYINRGTDETNLHTDIFELTGTCNVEALLGEIPAYTTITADAEVEVYAKANMQDILNEVVVSHDAGETKVSIPNLVYENKQLEGKQIVCFGDSLIGMYRNETSATAHIAKMTGATVHNVGFGGCRMSKHPTSGYAEFSMCELAKAIVNNDWTSQDASVGNGGSYFPEQLEKLKALDFNDVDIVVIHYGTNDYASAVVLNGEDATDNSTVCGALRYSVETLLATYPHLRIYVSLPVFRYWTTDGTVTYPNTHTNALGKSLIDYIDSMRGVAKEYNLPVIDGYHGMGINNANASVFFEDGTHHNMVGRELFGTYIGSKILANSGDGTGGGNGSGVDIPSTLPNPHALTFTGAVTGTYDGSQPLEVEIPSGGSGGTEEHKRIELTDSVAILEPNKFYVFPEMTSLSVTFGGEVNTDIVQEYKFRFVSGATPTTLSLPESVIGDITINANSVVEISIIDGFALCQSWGVGV